MENFSLLSLSLNSLTKGTLITSSVSTRKQLFTIEKSQFKNSFSSIFYGNNPKIQLKFIKSSATNFLERAITLSNEEEFKIIGEKWSKSHESFALGHVTVEDSTFVNCIFNGAQGGAIISLCPAKISKSKFFKCKSRSGGALAIMNNMDLQSTTFLQCFAKKGGAVQHQFGECLINSCLFGSCSSNLAGGAYNSMDINKHLMSNTNITSCATLNDAAAAFIDNCETKLKQNSVTYCHIKRGTGGYVLKGCEGEMTNCIFHKNFFDDIVGGGASSVELCGNEGTVKISGSFFSKCSDFNYWSIRGRDKISATISYCYFSNKESIEIDMKKAELSENYFNAVKIPYRFPDKDHKEIATEDQSNLLAAYARIISSSGKIILPIVIIILVVTEIIESIKLNKLRKKNIE